VIVSIIGLGYIGLPTAAVLASKGVKVVGVDVNQHAVDTINQGKIHIIEPELDILVHKAVQDNYLKAVTRPEKADVFMVAVPTPFKDNYEPDLSYIKSAAKAIATVLERGNLVILESTSPIGATEKMMEWMREDRPDLSFPKFGDDKFKVDIAVAADCLITDCRTAELSKLVENSFRDVNIAFANELSLICDKLDINVWELIKLANRHPRVNILQPGPGVGGHCIAVDPWFIVDSAPEEARLIQMARQVNDSKPLFVLNKVNQAIQALGKETHELSIACLGLAFKADIDDLRESPALSIAVEIASIDFSSILLVEPNIDHVPRGFNNHNVELVSLERAIHTADIIIVLVDHVSFKSIDLNLLYGKQVIDTRGIWS